MHGWILWMIAHGGGLEIMGIDSLDVTWIGGMAVGEHYAVALDTLRNLAFLGSGGNVIVLDISNPAAVQYVSGLPGTNHAMTRGIFYQETTQRLFIAQGSLLIVDVSQPSNPILLAEVHLSGVARDVFVRDTVAFIANGTGLASISVANPYNPVVLDEILWGAEVQAVDGYGTKVYPVYVASTGARILKIDAQDPSNLIQEGGHFVIDGDAGDVVVKNGYVYAAVGSKGLVILDTTSSLNLLGSYNMYAEGVEVHGTLAYVASPLYFGTPELVVIDVSNPASPQRVGGYNTANLAYDVVAWNNKVFLAERMRGLTILDVTSPANIFEIGWFDAPLRVGWGIIIQNQLAYLLDNRRGVWIMDLDRQTFPYISSAPLSVIEFPVRAENFHLDQGYLYVATRNGGVRIVDVTDSTAPVEIGSAGGSDQYYAVFARGSTLYAGNGSLFRLEIWDVTTPSTPALLGFLDLIGNFVYEVVRDITVIGNLAYVLTNNTALYVVDVSDPSSPVILGSYDPGIPGNPSRLSIEGTHAYVGDWTELLVLDISVPSNPVELSRYSTGWNITGVQAQGPYVYVAHDLRLHVLDVSNPSSPLLVGSYDLPSGATDLWAREDTVWVINSDKGVGTFRALNTPLSSAEQKPVHHSPASATVAEYDILVRSSEPAHGHLFDLSGRSVWKGNLLPGTTRIQKRLSPGIYQLELRFSGGDREIIPILRP